MLKSQIMIKVKSRIEIINGYEYLNRSGYNLTREGAPTQIQYIGAPARNASRKTMNLEEKDNLQTYIEHNVFNRLSGFIGKALL